ncbi:MAG: sensor histidine kinase [Crocinitomicaceae bacterium]|nr:sensor histidine kinase [Flavobacteriia bacterium]NDC27895.1 sensor histidine kinase [Crocinitomicaceae bacterium]NDC92153.1 sensor histidine kinase [Flavobacteriales bacterium]
MKRFRINAVIILGVLSLSSILLVQLLWVRKTIEIQSTSTAIQQKSDSLNLKEFSEQTNLALRNVLNVISNAIEDSSEHYGAIKQLNVNQFKVDIIQELDPYYLETLLKKALYNQNIHEDFTFGIYDCFTNQLTFSKLYKFTDDSLYTLVNNNIIGLDSARLKLKNDGHYFTVFFPNVQNKLPQNTVFLSPWIYISTIVFLVLIFFGFSLATIIKQKRLSEVITDFINNMTHELKTPIATISLSSEMIMRLETDDDLEKAKKYAGIIFKENKRLETQVERVLNISTLDTENTTLNKKSLDFHELLVEVKDTFDFNQLANGGKILIENNASVFTIQADPIHITNVVYNLLDNAVKYCTTKPFISITTKNERNYLVIEIKDNGIGIRKEDLKMIFDKFYRVSTGNIHDIKGFGLGLFYVKLIINEHNGSIDVKSKIGEGSTFIIKLPH